MHIPIYTFEIKLKLITHACLGKEKVHTEPNRSKLIRPTKLFDCDSSDLAFQTSVKIGESQEQYGNL